MDYEKAYKEAIKRAKAIIEVAEKEEEVYKSAITIFPELCESEDEQIRKWIIDDIRYNMNNEPLNNSEYKKKAEKAIAWLEKQGQKPILDFKAKDWYVSKVDGKIRNIYHSVDKVEPKFNVGDWVADNNGKVAIIYDLQKTGYVGHYTDGTDFICKYSNEYLYHLWTIQDAKDGDVLVCCDNKPFIFKGFFGLNFPNCLAAYCGITLENQFRHCNGKTFWTNQDVKPATKEQRDTLFSKMHEAGYEWNAEKKELKKIEQKPQRMVSAEAKEALYDKPAWSEEDERMIDNIIFELEENQENISGVGYKIDWLKQLKQRHTWKPSEEQMQALKDACDKHWEPDGLDPLYTLYEQLKMLTK